MSYHIPTFLPMNRMSPDAWIARREDSIQQIRDALTEGAMTVGDIAERFGAPEGTIYGHMVHMEKQGTAHRTGRRDSRRRVLWAVGPKPAASPAAEQEEAMFGSRTVPARQVGMWRDYMVAALFGPAQGAAVNGGIA